MADTRPSTHEDTSRRLLGRRLRWLRSQGNGQLIRGGRRGIEKESLRVDHGGRLAHTPHPRALGAALTHPYLTTDYSESLPEFVTAPYRSSAETLGFLRDLHAWTHHRLGDELLWPASMPCVLNADQDIPIADYGTSNGGLMKTVYRRGLGYRYGRAMQAIAGVHFNYSLPEVFWPAFLEHEGSREPLAEFRSAGFMALVRNYRRHAWLVTYLFGASPALCKSFRPEGHELLTELDRATWHAPFATSLRMSDLGYRNKTQGRIAIPVNSLADYVAGLKAAVTTVEPRYEEIGVVVDGEYRQLNANILQIENEYYSAIRPKPSKASPRRPIVALRTLGVEYVEVRTLDLNPADPVGVDEQEMRFVEALLIYCALAASPPIDAREQAEIDQRDLAVAREGRRPGLRIVVGGRERPLSDAGIEALSEIGEVAELLEQGDGGYVAAVERARDAFREPEATPSAAVLRNLAREQASFFEYALALARGHHAHFLERGLGAEPAARFDELARRSLAEADALERDRTQSFEAYLKDYFADV